MVDVIGLHDNVFHVVDRPPGQRIGGEVNGGQVDIADVGQAHILVQGTRIPTGGVTWKDPNSVTGRQVSGDICGSEIALVNPSTALDDRIGGMVGHQHRE